MSSDPSMPPGEKPQNDPAAPASGNAGQDDGGGGSTLVKIICVGLLILIVVQIVWLVQSYRSQQDTATTETPGAPSAPASGMPGMGMPGMGGSPGPGMGMMPGMGGSPRPGMGGPGMGGPGMGGPGMGGPGMGGPGMGGPGMGGPGMGGPGMGGPGMGGPGMGGPGMGASPVPGMGMMPGMGASPRPGMMGGPGMGGPGMGGPGMGGPGMGGPGGTTGGGGIVAPVDELPRLINKIVSLNDSKTPLDAAQRAKLRPVATKMVEASSRMQADLTKAVSIMRPDQFSAMITPHPEIMQMMTTLMQQGPVSPGSDAMLTKTIEEVRKSITASGSASPAALPTSAPQPGAMMVSLDRRPVAMGILYLQSKKELALSPEQAKIVLESLEDCNKQLGVLSECQSQLFSLLTPAQLTAVGTQTISVSEQVVARCLLYAVDGPGSAKPADKPGAKPADKPGAKPADKPANK